MSAQTYQVGAHFKALNKGILVAAMKMLEKFFLISSVSEAQWKRKKPGLNGEASLWPSHDTKRRDVVGSSNESFRHAGGGIWPQFVKKITFAKKLNNEKKVAQSE